MWHCCMIVPVGLLEYDRIECTMLMVSSYCDHISEIMCDTILCEGQIMYQ